MRVHDISKLVTKKVTHIVEQITTQKKKATITYKCTNAHVRFFSIRVPCKINIKRVKFKICISSVSKLIHVFNPLMGLQISFRSRYSNLNVYGNYFLKI